MKVIIAGATGFVGTDLVHRALSNTAITSVVALARREVAVPQNTTPEQAKKLKPVVCENFESYSEKVKQELSGAAACIWVIAITPSRSKTMAWEEVRKICLDYTLTGLETISQLQRDHAKEPFRFIYVSGIKAERDQTKKPLILGGYTLMRGEVENRVLEYAKKSGGSVSACVAKPGLIDGPGRTGMIMTALQTVGTTIIGLPRVGVSEVSATLLDQAVNGFEKETLLNEDLVRIGRSVLAKQ
ncbi:hypothetical protein F5884DRAFT_899859 [Xylogone sp. PMI_703]|nr:hypothetical protein F5884DRAFT_899859 [Xylogone sp. PMI_703]